MADNNYSINIKDGRIVFRTDAVDELKALYRPVADDIVQAITDGKVESMAVVNAIMKRERYSDEFDWEEFQRQEKALNMRQAKIEFGDENYDGHVEQDVEAGVSLGLLGLDGKKPAAEPAKAEELPPLPKTKVKVNV